MSHSDSSNEANPYQTPQSELPARMVACVGCGKEIHVTAATCPLCGASQRSKGYKSKVAAAMLALFFGAFGIHRFYLGQWWGIFYLVLFWTGIPSLVSLIECVVFLVSDTQNWDRKYNEGKPAAPGEGSGMAMVLAIIAGIFVFIAVIGILAAIAVPQYQTYVLRAKVMEGVNFVRPIQQQVVAYRETNHAMPKDNVELGLESPLLAGSGTVIVVNKGSIELKLRDDNASINGQTILFIPRSDAEGVQWSCTEGSMEERFRPIMCR